MVYYVYAMEFFITGAYVRSFFRISKIEVIVHTIKYKYFNSVKLCCYLQNNSIKNISRDSHEFSNNFSRILNFFTNFVLEIKLTSAIRTSINHIHNLISRLSTAYLTSVL